MLAQNWRILIKPVEESEMEVSTGCKDRRKNLEELSIRYLEKNAKCLNEVYKDSYRKTVINSCTRTKEPAFYINIYSKKPLSNLEVYAIYMTYKNESRCNSNLNKTNFLSFLKWCYAEFEEIKEIEKRISLYEYFNDSLIIVLDVEPKELGFDTQAMKLTLKFNEKQSNGKYETVIKVSTIHNIIVITNEPISPKAIIKIKDAYIEAQLCRKCEWENATSDEFAMALNKKEIYKDIGEFEYGSGFLKFEII